MARGHKMERQNYLDHIVEIEKTTKKKTTTIAIDTDVDKGTQSQSGFWVSKQLIRQSQKQKHGDSSNDTDTSSSDDATPAESQRETAKSAVRLRGCVNVESADLIPDGRGGYFVHITKGDIQPLRPMASQQQPPRRENWRARPSASATYKNQDGRVGTAVGNHFVTPVEAYENFQQSPLAACYDNYRPSKYSRFSEPLNHTDRFSQRNHREARAPSKNQSRWRGEHPNHASVNSGNVKRH